MDNIAIVVADSNEGYVFLSTPSRRTENECAVFGCDEWETAKDGCHVLYEEILKIPAGTDDDDRLERSGGLGILADGMFVYGF